MWLEKYKNIYDIYAYVSVYHKYVLIVVFLNKIVLFDCIQLIIHSFAS